MSTPGSPCPPFGQLFPSLGHDELVAGEIWTCKQNEENWPVVICDEAIVSIFFGKDRHRPYNARKADGTWPEGYESGGPRVHQRSYPTIILGKLRFTWLVRQKLQQFENDLAQAIRETTKNPLLAQGYHEAFRLHTLDDPLPDVKKAIHQLRLGRGHPKGSTGSDDIANVKRKGTPLSKYSCSIEETDDEEPKAWGFRQSSTSDTIKKEPGVSCSFANMNAGDVSIDLKGLDSDQAQKKSRLDTLGRSSMRTSTPLRAGTQNLTSRRTSMSRATPVSSIKEIVDDPNKVTVYVDNPHTRFGLTRSGLAASPLLSKMLTYHLDHGWYVMAPILSQLNKDDFFPVGQYLERGEYDPNILDEGTDWVRLVSNVSGRNAATEVMRCATIYDIAGKLEIAGLLDLAFRKLKTLAKNEPHQASAILGAVDVVFKYAKPNMKQYLVKYLAEQFWNLMTEENGLLARIMESNDELRERVCSILAGRPEAEDETEAERKTKVEERFDEVKGESGSPKTVEGEEAESSLIGAENSQQNTSPYHATVATATGEDPPEDDQPGRTPAGAQNFTRPTAEEILTAVNECDALDDEAAAYGIAATLPYPLPAVLPAEIEQQMRDGLGDSFESVRQILDDLREDDAQLNGEEDARLLEG